MTDKAVAVVLHPGGAPARLLVFDHPEAGTQLVKGGIEPGERPLQAARRELDEESGLLARSGLMLGRSDAIVDGEIWHFALLRVALPVRDTWRWKTPDGGGLTFDFRWMPLELDRMEGRFARAQEWIRRSLA